MEYQTVENQQDLMDCRELVLEAYQKKQLEKYGESFKLFKCYDGNDFTTIYSHTNGAKKITISALYDYGYTSLTLDKYYKKELQRLRKSDPKIGEFGHFSDNRAATSFRTINNLSSVLFGLFFLKGFKQIIFGVHPYSVKFLKKNFKSTILISVKTYEKLNRTLFVLLYISFHESDPKKLSSTLQYCIQKTIHKHANKVASFPKITSL